MPETGRKDLNSSFAQGSLPQTKITVEPTRTIEVTLTEPARGAVTVRLKDQDGKPVSGVNLAAFQWDPESRTYQGSWSTGATDDKGQALFDPLLPGRYVFHPSTGGSEEEPLQRYAITLKGGQHHQLDMVLSHGDINRLKDRLQSPIQLRGQVVLPDGSPAEAAAIYLAGERSWIDESHPNTRADAEGRFTLETWRLGRMTIAARSHGTALSWLSAPITTRNPDPVQLVLQTPATVHGRVAAQVGSPADVRVCALPEPSMTEPRVSGDPYGNGSFPLSAPVRPDSSFTLYGVSPGKQTLCLYRQGRLQLGSIQTLDLRAGEERKDVRLTAEPECPGLEIRFRRADGQPMPEYYEARLYTDFGSLSCGGLDEKRNIARTRAPLPAGRYHLWLDTTTGEQTLDRFPGLIRRNIQVRPGQDIQKLEIVLPRAGAVQGRVLLSNGTPAAGLRVAVHATGLSDSRTVYAPLSLVRGSGDRLEANLPSYAGTWVDPDGVFTLFGLVPGRYRLAVLWRGRDEPLFVSEPVQVEEGRIAPVGTWKIQ